MRVSIVVAGVAAGCLGIGWALAQTMKASERQTTNGSGLH
jgi:hypothetical protein